MIVRQANPLDFEAITNIYNWHVSNGFATFDEAPISVDDRKEWFKVFGATGRYRILVAEVDSDVVGYVCSIPYRHHAAFKQTIEVSIYLSDKHVRLGIGSALYGQLFSELSSEPIHTVLAGIALPNEASVALHKKFGFREVGVFEDYASKNGRRVSSLWMQKMLE